MTLIALIIVVVALANGMEADAFIDAVGTEWNATFLVIAFFLALFGDIKRAL